MFKDIKSPNGGDRDEFAELLINKDKSFFRSLGAVQQDARKFQDLKIETADYIPTRNGFRILKSFDDQKINFFAGLNSFEKHMYKVTEDMDLLDWELMPDTMTISGMKCQLAKVDFGNRTWNAWFNPDIRISDGPYKFSNLPGLIIKIQDQTATWSFSFVEMKEVEPVDFYLSYFDTNTPISKIDFYKAKKEFTENQVSIHEASGRLQLDEATRKHLMTLDKTRDWTIEIEPYLF